MSANSNRDSKMSRKKQNPLYVVTNKGKDVQEAKGFFDLVVKKFGLEGIVGILEGMMSSLFEMVTSYAMFVSVKNFFDQIFHQIELVLARLGLGPIVPLKSRG